MADSNVTLVGNVTKEPEIRYTSGGRAQVSFGLAVNRRYQVNNEWQEQTSFFNVVAWGTLAENVAASLTKGSRAVVTGRLEQRTYETKEGEKRNVVEVIAEGRREPEEVQEEDQRPRHRQGRVRRLQGRQPPHALRERPVEDPQPPCHRQRRPAAARDRQRDQELA